MRGMRRKRRRSCRYLPPARTHALGRATESQLVQPVVSQAMQREKRPQAVSALVHCAAVHAALPEIPRSVAVRSAHARCRPTRLDRANKSRALVHMIGSRWIVCRADVKYLRTSIVNRGEARWAQGAGRYLSRSFCFSSMMSESMSAADGSAQRPLMISMCQRACAMECATESHQSAPSSAPASDGPAAQHAPEAPALS